MTRYDADSDFGYRPTASMTDRANAFLSAVYGWMCAGLAMTATSGWLIAGSPAIVGAIAGNRGLFWALLIGQLAIVFVLSARVQRLAASTAAILFVLYSALTGVTMAFVLLAFTGERRE
jgi:FtsH-binding integral membrane protein